MGSFFHLRTRLHKEDACGCFSWISECFPIKPHFTNLVSGIPEKEEPVKEEPQNKEEPIKLPIINLELLKSRASMPEGLSLKELYEFLCKNILVFDDNKKKLWIDEQSLKSCLMVSPKALDITWVKDERYWNWIPVEKSSFDEVARLDSVTWFEVRAKIECGFLSPATKYRVSFRVKFDRLKGWERSPAKISLSTNWGFRYESARFFSDLKKPVGMEGLANATFRVEEDAWVELDAGCFELPENLDEGMISNGEVEVSITQLESMWKSGIIIDCIKAVPVETSK